MEVKKLLKGDLDYMETKIKIKIEYEPTNKIYLSSNKKRTLIYLYILWSTVWMHSEEGPKPFRTVKNRDSTYY